MRKRICLLLFINSLSLCALAQSTPASFSKKDVVQDIDYLYESLKEAHYNPFAYVSEKDFEMNYLEVQGSLAKDSFNLLEATNLFQRVISVINNGHTSIDFPGQSYMEYAYSGGTLFPLEVAFEDGKSLVRKNWSANDSIKAGSEILSINGMPVNEILSKIYPQISAERSYFKNVKIELYSLPRYYWQVFGKQDEFEVEIRTDGAVKKYSLEAVSVLDGYELKRNEVFNAEMKLEFMGSNAYLNPGDFSGDEQKYRQFIDSAFAKIIAEKSVNLIIDLRNNRGGDDTFSDYLVSYIADRPFKWNSRFTLKTSKFLKEHIRKNKDTTSVFYQEALSHNDGEIYDYNFEEYQPQPEDIRFKGQVYVLVNRQSHSQSAVTAAQIQDYEFGTLVGEETGDYPSLYASIYQYNLPNTQILVHVSKGYMVRVNGSTKEEGVIPDILVRDHLLDEEDEILTSLLNRLN